MASDPFGVDDWLPSSLLNPQDDGPVFPTDFLTTPDSFAIDKLPDPLSPCISEDELDQLFEQPNRSTSSMRTAFSMNDLQSLQLETSTPAWQPRGASVKPTLESVPEGGPPPSAQQPSVGLTSSTTFQPLAPDYQASPFQPLSAQPGPVDAKVHAPYLAQPPYHPPGHDEASFPAPMIPSMYAPMPYPGHPMPVPMPPGMAPGMHPVMPPGMAPGMAAGMAPMPMPMPMAMPGMPPPMPGAPHMPMPMAMMQARGSTGSDMATSMAGYTMQSSPEHHMVDAVKPDPSGDTDSSGNSQPQKLQPTAAALRKSHSALELGAWRKMAAGDLDSVDPSGSVRETLQGLESCQHIGKLTPEERLQKILRYRAKRHLRNFNRTIKYQCRKSLADTRPRVRGRFARDNEPGSVLPHETKKALREKTKGKSPPPGQEGEQPPEQQIQQQQQAPIQKQVAAMSTAPVAGTVGGLAHAIKQEPALGSSAGPAVLPPAAQPVEGEAFFTVMPAPPAAADAAEHHVTALAHLYNQWSEVVGPEATTV